MTKFEENGKKNGFYNFNGKTYAALKNPEFMADPESRWYEAYVIDENNYIYTMTWEETKEHLAYVVECEHDGVWIDEADACEWNNPVSCEPYINYGEHEKYICD